MPLTMDTVLGLADGVSIIRSHGAFKISLLERRLQFNRYSLSILDVFANQKTLAQGMEQLETRLKGTSAWVDVIATIKGFYEFGVLVEPGGQGLRRAHENRFDAAPIHITMLDDERRTSSFQSAIRRTVKPSDVVVEIGAGTGVLAVTAAMAGARHVYAIEATAMSRVVERLADVNGLSDRVTVIQAHSFDVDLPEKANVLISETIGDDPLGEGILPTFADARQRLLVDDAVGIPSRLQLRALALEVPEDWLRAFRFTASGVAVWKERYGIDFSALVETSEAQDHLLHTNSYQTRGWKRLAEPTLVGDFDLLRFEPPVVEQHVTFHTIREGFINGILLFFEADLGAGVHLSLHPDDAAPSNSWGNLLYVFGRPIEVMEGEELRMCYSHDDRGSRIQLTA